MLFAENTTKLFSRALSGRSDPNSSWWAPRSLLEADSISILSLAGRYRREAVIGREHQYDPHGGVYQYGPTTLSEVMFLTLSSFPQIRGKRVFRLQNYCFASRREAIRVIYCAL
ncbi:hypothetical protein CDAR_208641 [Caerostris darwini]|uniref:Uncharacterized protein n=1 Tax=Caerostris darwini TaxID=1538125 RepID=A0AAV4VQI1_9ARAC|nr:hypothetical protein CDAR_208641 [Caerostris darwini]